MQLGSYSLIDEIKVQKQIYYLSLHVCFQNKKVKIHEYLNQTIILYN